MTNWWVILVLGIWFFATVGAIVTKKNDPYGPAALITLFIGLGWLIIR